MIHLVRLSLVGLCLLSLSGFAASPQAPPALIRAKQTLQRFYENYLNSLHKPAAAQSLARRGETMFSRILRSAIDLNRSLCHDKAKGEVCGWGADGNPFLGAQDYGDNLNFSRSGFSLTEKPGRQPDQWIFEASFALFTDGSQRRAVQYLMKLEAGQWVVADIIYDSTGDKVDTALKQLKAEIDLLYGP